MAEVLSRRSARLAGATLACGLLASSAAACGVIDPPRHERSLAYSAVGARTVVVDSGVGDVQVIPGGSTVAVTEHWIYRNGAPTTSHALANGALTLRSDCPGGNCQVDYTVRMPASDTLRVTLGTGTVRLSNLSGRVTVTDGTGDVVATGLHSTRTDLATNTGDVTAGFADAPAALTARSETGDVRLTLPAGSAYAVDAHTDTGTTHVQVPRDAGSPHSVSAVTDTGNVAVDAG